MRTKLTQAQRAALEWIRNNLVNPDVEYRSPGRSKVDDYLLMRGFIFRHADGYFYLTDAGREALKAGNRDS